MADPLGRCQQTLLRKRRVLFGNLPEVEKINSRIIKGLLFGCLFLQIPRDVCETALIQLSILLCHRHTYVRKATSTRLYESLLVYGEFSTIPEDNLDQVMTLLSETNWENPVEELRPVRNSLCDLMGVRAPVVKKKAQWQ